MPDQVIFHSDLDNTLIYSGRRKITGEKLCVEWNRGREFSFMTRRSYDLLLQVMGTVCFVPTTTRSVEQYKRIRLGEKEPDYALACNGGILLVKGVRDLCWHRESLELAAAASRHMEAAAALLDRDRNRNFEVRNLEGLFLFTRSDQPMESLKNLKENLDPEHVDVFVIGQKLYVLPKALNKGTAVERLKKRLGGNRVVAAGDSLMDVSMLEAADCSFLPLDLARQIERTSNMSVFEGEGTFSDYVLEGVLEYV